MPATSEVSQSASPLANAYQHLSEVMDQYHLTFDVYTDVGAGGNHFVHRAMIGADVSLDDAYTGTVKSGATAISNTFTAAGDNWGGFYFQNGVLLAGDTTPRDSWGTNPEAGYDLSGATRLTFWGRGAHGGERVEFFAFGLGRDPATGEPLPGHDYPDSSAKVTTCGSTLAPCFVTLSDTWQLYTITLPGLDLRYVIGGFGWVTNAPQNSNQSITFFLDDIRYDKVHLQDLRLLQSYVTLPANRGFDLQFRNTAFTYDNALALIAFTAAGHWGRTRLLADTFVYAQAHDRYYSDGRLRNAYQSGDLMSPPGWTSNGKTGTARLPGWWDSQQNRWIEDPELLGTSTGNLAWVIIALLNYYEQQGGEVYLTSTITLGNWIEAHTFDSRGAGGYTGGYTGEEHNPGKLLWKSTEHNLDLHVAFTRLFRITRDPIWQARAEHARDFVEAMWNGADGYYFTGTLDNGETPNTTPVPLDCQTWALLAFGETPYTLQAIAYAATHHSATYDDFDGFDFDTDRDMPWLEGTGQMVVDYWLMGDTDNAQYYLSELRWAQNSALNGNDKGIVAAPADGLTTGLGWVYYNRLHVGATVWFIFAEQRYDPYRGIYLSPEHLYLPLLFKH